MKPYLMSFLVALGFVFEIYTLFRRNFKHKAIREIVRSGFACLGIVFLVGCSSSKKTITKYPEKFEGLTQLVLASQTQTLSFTDTTVQKILGVKLGSAQVTVTASVTFDFYLDFAKDGYTMSFSTTADTLVFNAPVLRVKKPVINASKVSYPEKHLLVNEQEQAVKKLETLTDEFSDEGNELLKQKHVVDKCTEMLDGYLKDLCKKMGYATTLVLIRFPSAETP